MLRVTFSMYLREANKLFIPSSFTFEYELSECGVALVDLFIFLKLKTLDCFKFLFVLLSLVKCWTVDWKVIGLIPSRMCRSCLLNTSDAADER